jgi:hypothetical protein
MSSFLDLWSTSSLPLPALLPDFRFSNSLPKRNTLQHAAPPPPPHFFFFFFWPVKSLGTIFVKIVFMCKSFLKIHLTVSCLNSIPEPPLGHLSIWTNKIPHLFNTYIGSEHFQSVSFNILHVLPTLSELFMPLPNILFINNFCALYFRQHCARFTCTLPLARVRLPTHIHASTQTSLIFVTALTHLMLQCWHHSLHRDKTSTDELLNSSTNDVHINKKVPLQACHVYNLCKYTSSKFVQAESVSVITQVRIQGQYTCHNAIVPQHYRLSSAKSAQVNIPSSITMVSCSTHAYKMLKTSKMF